MRLVRLRGNRGVRREVEVEGLRGLLKVVEG